MPLKKVMMFVKSILSYWDIEKFFLASLSCNGYIGHFNILISNILISTLNIYQT